MEHKRNETPDESPPPKKITLSCENFLFSEDLHDVVFEFEDDAWNVIDGMSSVQACKVGDTCNCPKNNNNEESTPFSQGHCGCNNEKLNQIKKQTIPAHAEIIAANSEVFRVQLFGALKERTIKIRDASADNFRTFLRCIYTRELRITIENMFELAYLGNKYMIWKITELVADFFKDELNEGKHFWKLFNPQGIALFDDEEKSLLTMLLARLESGTKKYLNSKEFLSLSEEMVGELVRCEPLSIKEVDLYRAVVRWAEFQCKRDGMSLTESNMRSFVKSFVHDLRMPTIRLYDLIYAEGIHTNQLLIHEEKVNLAAYCSGLTSVDTPFVKIPRLKSRDVYICTAEATKPIETTKRAKCTHVVPIFNFRFVGVTYVLDIQKAGPAGEEPRKVITEVRSSESFSEKLEDYDLLCSFEWVASPGMEVSEYEVVSMAKDIVMFSVGRYYIIFSRPTPGISILYFRGDFKKDHCSCTPAHVCMRRLKYWHTARFWIGNYFKDLSFAQLHTDGNQYCLFMGRQRKRETRLMDESTPSKKLAVSYDNFLFSEDLHDVVFEFESDVENVIDGAPSVEASEVDNTCNSPESDANGQTIPAHALILAFSSEVFRAQLFGALQERTIKITDASVDNFRTFLRCIYTGELQITTENMFELAYLANKYLIPKITQLVTEFFKDELSKDENFWKLFNPQRVALFDDEEKSLLNMLLARFESDTEKYLKSEEFLSLSEEIVGELARCEPLSIKEVDLYRAVVRWAEFQCKRNGMGPTESNMRSCVKSFVHNLRMPTLRHDELFYNGGIHTNKLLLHEEKVNLAAYWSGLTSIRTPFVKMPRLKSRDVNVCTAELQQPSQLVNTAMCTHVVPNVNFRFVGVTYLLDIQKEEGVTGKVITEVRSSENFSESFADYDLLCSFEWVASPGMEVSEYEVVSMANDIIMFSSDRYYRIVSRPTPGIAIHYFKGDFKDASSQVYIRMLTYLHTTKSVHFLLP